VRKTWSRTSYHHFAFDLELRVLARVLEEEIDRTSPIMGTALNSSFVSSRPAPDDECKFCKRQEDEVVEEGRWNVNTLSSSSCQLPIHVHIRVSRYLIDLQVESPKGGRGSRSIMYCSSNVSFSLAVSLRSSSPWIYA
jgi:hypothetical protein